MKESGFKEKNFGNIRFIPPQSYRSMVWLMSNARAVITDSGGIQKEAYILRIPCITLRNTTEWVETVEDGWNVLVDNDMEALQDAIIHYSQSAPENHHMRYGNGSASGTIVHLISEFLKHT